ncbi:MAG: DUF1223 domain-containing protein [Bdellovibrionales bacterium]|nr:DUF1223 domain-containing protein [Bdellovibrionales bacterium]
MVVYAALLGHGLETKVPRGENANKTLKHEFVVLSLQKRSMDKKGAEYTSEIELPESKKAKSYSVAFWVSQKGQLAPLQVTGGPRP